MSLLGLMLGRTLSLLSPPCLGELKPPKVGGGARGGGGLDFTLLSPPCPGEPKQPKVGGGARGGGGLYFTLLSPACVFSWSVSGYAHARRGHGHCRGRVRGRRGSADGARTDAAHLAIKEALGNSTIHPQPLPRVAVFALGRGLSRAGGGPRSHPCWDTI